MIDSHCHLDLAAFDSDRDQVLARCQALGLTRLMLLGLQVSQFPHLLALHAQYPQCDISFGLHPYFLNIAKPLAELPQLFDMAHEHVHTIKAIGECGLDGSIDIAMPLQEQVLCAHIELAQTLNKPLILHHRQSHNDLIRVLKQQRYTGGGVVHAFSGSQQIAESYIDMGFKLGVGGIITYPRAKKTRTTLANTALEHLLLESDAPDMPLCGKQGQRNSPEYLPQIAQALAVLHNCEPERVSLQSTQNYTDLFDRTSLW